VIGMTIGEVARKTGLAPSAIRYYEKAGLLPSVRRVSKQRRFDPEILARIRIVQLALNAGFTIAETRTFLTGFGTDTEPSTRWRTLAARKLEEVNALMARAQAMKALLESSFRCDCLRIEDCERVIMARR
jgi:MerR family redox-sensitive transcriptional activator SoxR